MKHHGIEMVGPMILEKLSTLPSWSATDEGRLIYVEDEDKHYFGNNEEFYNPLYLKKYTTLPAWSSDDEGRIIYVEDEDKYYFGDNEKFYNPLKEDNFTVTVGSGGDYATIGAALQGISKYKTIFDTDGRKFQATINILSGTTITERIYFYYGDYSWIKFTSVDASVPVTVSNNFINGLKSILPYMSVKWDLNTSSAGVGAYLQDSRLTFQSSSSYGLINAPSHNLDIRDGSCVWADSCTFTGAGGIGVYVREGSRFNGRSCTITGSSNVALTVTDSSIADVYNATITSTGDNNIEINTNSMANCESVTATSSSGVGLLVSENCVVNARSINTSGSTGKGLSVGSNSICYAKSANLSNTAGVIVTGACVVNLDSATITGSSDIGVQCLNGSTVEATSCNVSNATSYGFLARYGGYINAQSADASSVSGLYGFRIYDGSVIQADNAAGTLSVTANTLSNHGIIYQ